MQAIHDHAARRCGASTCPTGRWRVRRGRLPGGGGPGHRAPIRRRRFDLVYSTEVIEQSSIRPRWSPRCGASRAARPGDDSRESERPRTHSRLRASPRVTSTTSTATIGGCSGDAGDPHVPMQRDVALVSAVGRKLPPRPRDFFYGLDHALRSASVLPRATFTVRNRDWLITVPALGTGETAVPGWCCPACRGELTQAPEELHCTGCGAAYPTRDGVPDFFEEKSQANA